MKSQATLALCLALLSVMASGFLSAQSAAVTSAFTYQGYLTDAGAAANGTYDLEFTLFNAASEGSGIAPPVTVDDVNVLNGLFTVMLDFGPTVFSGGNQWIQMGVRPGAESGAFAPLAPRQQVMSSPYAVRAASAATLDGVSASGFWRAGGNAGTSAATDFIGTLDAAPLNIRVNNVQAFRLETAASGIRAVVGGSNQIDESANHASILGGRENSIGASAVESAIVAGASNVIGPGQAGVFIGGGRRNRIEANNQYSSILSGRDNLIGSDTVISVVSGGAENTIGASVDGGAIVGGFRNKILASTSPTSRRIAPVILGGSDNQIGGTPTGQFGSSVPATHWSTIVGGDASRIGEGSGASVIVGGMANIIGVDSPFSFAAGRRCRINHPGCFMWADSQQASFSSAGDNTFNIRAAGGVHLNDDTSQFHGSSTRQMLNLYGTSYGIGVQSGTLYFRASAVGSYSWHRGGVHDNAANAPGAGGVEMMRLNTSGLRVNGTFVSASDRSLKENFLPVNSAAVLEKVVALPIAQWNYRADPESRHLGPMAQDFYAAFGVGPDDRHIASVDADGVALAAIQGLYRKVVEELERKDAELEEIRARMQRLESLLAQPSAANPPSKKP